MKDINIVVSICLISTFIIFIFSLSLQAGVKCFIFYSKFYLKMSRMFQYSYLSFQLCFSSSSHLSVLKGKHPAAVLTCVSSWDKNYMSASVCQRTHGVRACVRARQTDIECSGPCSFVTHLHDIVHIAETGPQGHFSVPPTPCSCLELLSSLFSFWFLFSPWCGHLWHRCGHLETEDNTCVNVANCNKK